MQVVAVHRTLVEQSEQDVFVGQGQRGARGHSYLLDIHNMSIGGVMIPLLPRKEKRLLRQSFLKVHHIVLEIYP
jgi:hypothetical protein